MDILNFSRVPFGLVVLRIDLMFTNIFLPKTVACEVDYFPLKCILVHRLSEKQLDFVGRSK